MAENMIKFLRGNVASLPSTAVEGALYFTKDEGVYLGLANGTYHRYGDFITVADVDSLPAAGAHENCMYYCVAENILAKWNGTGWTQINKQKTLAELGGVAKSVYDDKVTALEKADTDNATAISGLETLVGTIPEGATASTIVGYINEKTASVTSGTDFINLTNRVTATEGEIDALQTAIAEGGSVANAIADAKKAGTDAATAVTNLADGQVKTNKEAIEAINNESTGILAQAKTYADGKDITIAEAKNAADTAQAGVNALKNTVENAIGSAVEAVTADLDYTATGMGKGKTIKALTQVDGQIDAEFEDIEIAQNQVVGLTNVLFDINNAGTALLGRVKTIEDDYLKASDKSTLEAAIKTEKDRLDTFLASAEVGDAAIDTLKEIQDYIDTHGEAASTLTTKVGALETAVGHAADGESEATGLMKAVADNTAAISAEKTRAEGVEATLAQADADNLKAAKDYADQKISDLGITDYAKQADLDSHTGNSDIHITANERTKWNTAEGKAHVHTNKALLDTYTQTEENLADAVAKKHEHSNKTVLDGITAQKVSAWDSAQANAEATADAALASAKTELEGKITAAQTAAEGKVTELANGAVKTNADAITALQNGKADKATTLAGYGITDAYMKTETYTQSEINALLSWADF